MRRTHTALAGILVLSLSLGACILDPKTDTGDGGGGPSQKFQDLTQKWHVLNNLELAYLQRDINRYEELLDPAQYTFYFTDVQQGNPVPATMDRDKDLLVTGNIFTGKKGTDKEVVSLDLNLEWESAQWVELPPDSAGGRNETWWTTTVNYSFTIKTAGGTDYVTQGTPKAQFSVRKGADGKFRLVEWRDLGNV